MADNAQAWQTWKMKEQCMKLMECGCQWKALDGAGEEVSQLGTSRYSPAPSKSYPSWIAGLSKINIIFRHAEISKKKRKFLKNILGRKMKHLLFVEMEPLKFK
jgi:hypothetical protein